MLNNSIFIILLIKFAIVWKCEGETALNEPVDPDLYRNTSELIMSKGYYAEEHEVHTTDGYILGLQRILPRKPKAKKKYPILLLHGFASDSSSWVLDFPDQSLGFILSNQGYDVWLGNTRGSKYSKRHEILSSEEKEFWDFSVDEVAAYDIPAMIDLVLNVSEKKKLIYIGFSFGTTATFALLSENPEYNKKVKLFIALAPVTTGAGHSSGLKNLLPIADAIALLFRTTGVYYLDVSPSSKMISRFSNLISMVGNSTSSKPCGSVLFALKSDYISRINETRLCVYSEHALTTTSVKATHHFAQMMKSDVFQKYDYGRLRNWARYNQPVPPTYNISLISTPVVLIWSEKDLFATPSDIHKIEEQLSNLILSYQIPHDNFGHLDFMFSKDANKYVYDKVVTLLRKKCK